MNQDKIKILLVDDEEDILEILEYNLLKANYEVKTALNGEVALQILKEFSPHLVILDIMMPQLNGIEVCQKIRENASFNTVLITFLTAKSESFTQITALEAGGDDYITKPIKPAVFLSRVKAILRRHENLRPHEITKTLRFGTLEINKENYNVSIAGKAISLAKKEFELLAFLANKPGRVYRRQEILDNVWGVNVRVGDRTIDVHIRKLREKVGDHFIVTIKGVGYKFDFS